MDFLGPVTVTCTGRQHRVCGGTTTVTYENGRRGIAGHPARSPSWSRQFRASKNEVSGVGDSITEGKSRGSSSCRPGILNETGSYVNQLNTKLRAGISIRRSALVADGWGGELAGVGKLRLGTTGRSSIPMRSGHGSQRSAGARHCGAGEVWKRP
jgi:hypothetical protein